MAADDGARGDNFKRSSRSRWGGDKGVTLAGTPGLVLDLEPRIPRWAARMRHVILLTGLALFWSGSPPVTACPDAAYEKHLKALRVILPAVMAEQPAQTALADFFQALPRDFACFDRLFGYSDAPGPLYSEPQLYFLFPKFESVVPRQRYAEKLVALSVNARWEADQTGALQDATRSVLDNDAQLFIELLAKLDADSERSVWAFLFDAPHPSNEPLLPAVQAEVCKASERSCQLSKDVYAQAISKEHNH